VSLLDLLAKTLNKTQDEIAQLVTDGKVTFSDVKKAFENYSIDQMMEAWASGVLPVQEMPLFLTELQYRVNKAIKSLEGGGKEQRELREKLIGYERRILDKLIDEGRTTAQRLNYFKVFKGMSTEQLEKLHDDFVRKKMNVGTTAEPNANGVAQAKALGYSDEVIATFQGYKTIADALLLKLKEIYPDLEAFPTHYGQSLKWRMNGVEYTQEIDDGVVSEVSALEGSKHYTKMINTTLSTKEIAKKYNSTYRNINPHLVFLEYVKDASKLIALKEGIEQMTKTNGANGRPIAKVFGSILPKIATAAASIVTAPAISINAVAIITSFACEAIPADVSS